MELRTRICSSFKQFTYWIALALACSTLISCIIGLYIPGTHGWIYLSFALSSFLFGVWVLLVLLTINSLSGGNKLAWLNSGVSPKSGKIIGMLTGCLFGLDGTWLSFSFHGSTKVPNSAVAALSDGPMAYFFGTGNLIWVIAILISLIYMQSLERRKES